MDENTMLFTAVLAHRPYVVYSMVALLLAVAMLNIDMPPKCIITFGFLLAFTNGILGQFWQQIVDDHIQQMAQIQGLSRCLERIMKHLGMEKTK